MINETIKRTISAIIISLMVTNVIIACHISYIVFKPSMFSIENIILYSENYALQDTSRLETQNLIDLGQVDSLDLTVLSDNYPSGDLSTQWGLSILVETKNYTVLIDTGQSYNTLKDNSLSLNKDLSKVDFVVISHQHIDHIGGLSYIAEINPGVNVYVPGLIDNQTFYNINESDLNVIKIYETTIIQEGFAIIGELNGPPYEQALVVNVKDVGLVSLVGCSHPGVEILIEKGSNDLGYDPYMVIGGFHMLTASEQQIKDTIERLIELGVERIVPIHCSGDDFRQYMSEYYSKYYNQGNVGYQKTINKSTLNKNDSPLIFFFIFIPVTITSLAILTGWFIRRNVRKKRTECKEGT